MRGENGGLFLNEREKNYILIFCANRLGWSTEQKNLKNSFDKAIIQSMNFCEAYVVAKKHTFLRTESDG